MKLTKTTLKKLEVLFKELGYTVRYEKGNFTSGYCVVESRKVVVINRFYDTEGRCNTLLDVLSTVHVTEDTELTDASMKMLKAARKDGEPAVEDEETADVSEVDSEK